MATTARRQEMTVEEFLVWKLSQDQRYELIDGVPVPLRAMAGAKDDHDAIAIHLTAELRAQLRGGPCRLKTADTAVRTKIKRVRWPDVTIECAPVELGSLESRNPMAVFEVLSPTTQLLDRSEKLNEYHGHQTLRSIVHIGPGAIDVMVYTRNANGGWDDQRFQLPDDVFEIAGTSAALSLAAIYDGVPVQTGSTG